MTTAQTPAPVKGPVQVEKSNPAEPAGEQKRPPRVPMSAAVLRLKVKEIPGYKLHWFKEENVPAAQQAYYEFVKRGEIALNPVAGIGSSSTADGNTDLGTNVSIVAGKSEDGHPVRLILMKLKEEYANEDKVEHMKRNAMIMEAIFGEEASVGAGGEITPRDPTTYLNQDRTKLALFNRPVRKAKIGKRGR